jgi:hypothetical protein
MNAPYETSNPSVLKQLSGLTKDTSSFLTTFSLRMDSDSLVSQTVMLVSHQQCNFVLSEQHLAIFDFCCEVNAYINQQFASRRAKWLRSKERISEFALGQHTISMEQAKRLKVQVQDDHEEKMTILALVSAMPLESNVDMVLVRVDGLSHTVICPCQWTKETEWICFHAC